MRLVAFDIYSSIENNELTFPAPTCCGGQGIAFIYRTAQKVVVLARFPRELAYVTAYTKVHKVSTKLLTVRLLTQIYCLLEIVCTTLATYLFPSKPSFQAELLYELGFIGIRTLCV